MYIEFKLLEQVQNDIPGVIVIFCCHFGDKVMCKETVSFLLKQASIIMIQRNIETVETPTVANTVCLPFDATCQTLVSFFHS